MHSLSEGRKIVVEVLGETVGEGDQARLGQVFSNLIGNALQYSFPDSTVDVRIAGEADHVALSVHNDSEPIPLDEQKSIFKPLKRGTDSGAATRSTNLGLGLFITHKIITAHGGTISVNSAPNAGTTFTVFLPRQARAAAKASPGSK